MDYAKKNPGKLTTVRARVKARQTTWRRSVSTRWPAIKTTYVAFKGTGKAVTALLGDQVLAEWGYTSVGADPRGEGASARGGDGEAAPEVSRRAHVQGTRF